MRKFYNFFALLLLFFFGATNAHAQYHQFGEQIVGSVDNLVGKEFVLRGGFRYDEGRVMYPGKDGDITNVLSENCLYTIELLDGELSADGKQTYALKHVRSNKYVIDRELNSNSSALGYTSERIDAQKFVVLPSRMPVTSDPSENPYCDRQIVFGGNANQRFTDEGFTFTLGQSGKYGDNEQGVDSAFTAMCMHTGPGVAFWSYLDTNYWEAWTITDAAPLDMVNNAVNMYFPNGMDISTYPVGTNPGEYDAAILAEIEAAYKKAEAYLNSGEVTLEQAKACIAELEAAYEKFDDALIMPEAGYYFVTDFRTPSVTWYASDEVLMGYKPYELPAEPGVDDARYFTEFISVTDAEGKPIHGKYLIKNYLKGTYVTNTPSTRNDKAFVMGSVEEADTFTLMKANSPLGFEIYNSNGDQLNSAINSGMGIHKWNSHTDLGSQWKLTPIDKALVEALEGQIAQNELNKALKVVYDEAVALWAEKSTPKYEGEATPDDNFIDIPGFVVDPTQVEVHPLETSEGSIANMFDSNFSTYMHTAWSYTPNPTYWHYMQVDFGEEAKQEFQVKYAKRLRTVANNNPTLFKVWATNDTTGGGTWTDEGWTSFAYDYACMDSEKEYANSVGISGVTLSKPYRYVRLECHKTFGMEVRGDKPIWYLSEIRFYEGHAVPGSSKWEILIPEAVRAEFEKQLANAAAHLEAGAATKEDAELLQAALDAVDAYIPNPQLATNALSSAKKLHDGTIASGDGEVGTYPVAAKEALQATIEAATLASQKENITVAEIDKIVTDLAAAKETYRSQVVLPEAGKVYIIYGPTAYSNSETQEGALKGYNALVGVKNCQLKGGVTYVKAVGDDKQMVDYSTRPDLLWVVETATEGKLTLKNVATGLYMGLNETEEWSSPLMASVEPVQITLQGSSAPGVIHFYLGTVDGAEAYANFGGSNIVAWSTAVPNDNSAFGIMEALNLDSDGICNWPAATGYQVMTLPFEIMGESYSGLIYDVKGVNDEQQLVLTAHDAAENIPAGTPFVFWGDDDPDMGLVDGLAMFMLAQPVGENGELAVSHEALESNGLQGVLLESKVIGEGFGIFYKGKLRVTRPELNEDYHTVASGSGYFTPSLPTGVTAEDGDVTFDLPAPITSIDNVVVLPAQVDVYTLGGVLVRKNVKSGNAVKGLPAGVYVVGGQKLLVK